MANPDFPDWRITEEPSRTASGAAATLWYGRHNSGSPELQVTGLTREAVAWQVGRVERDFQRDRDRAAARGAA